VLRIAQWWKREGDKMAHRTEGECPIATNIFIRKQAKRLGVSLEAMIKKYAEEAERPVETIRHWVWPRSKETVKTDSKDNPRKKQAKPEIIEENEVGTINDVTAEPEKPAPISFEGEERGGPKLNYYYTGKKTKVYSSKDNSQEQLQSLVTGSEVAEIPLIKSGYGAGKVIPLKPAQKERKGVKKRTPKESIFTDEFRQAVDKMRFSIQNAKKERWKNTTQEAVLFHLKALEQIATIT